MSNNKIGWCFNNTYSKLPDKFSTKINPVPVKAPQLVILNENLSKELNKQGYNIARRTISKYREQLGFPVARLRKEL